MGTVAKMMKRPFVQVALSFVLADAVLMVLLHRGVFAPGREFALGMIFGANLGAFLVWRMLASSKRNLRT